MATIENARLSLLIERVYGAAAETRPAILRRRAGAPTAKSGLLQALDLSGERSVLASHHHNLDPARQAEYCAHFVGANPYLEAPKRFPAGRMVSNDQLLDLTLYRHTPLYQHYAWPLDNHFIVGGYVERHDDLYTILGLHRHSGARPRDPDEDWAVSAETRRSHLKAVFDKTGVRRQTELVRLLAGAPWKLSATAPTPEPVP